MLAGLSTVVPLWSLSLHTAQEVDILLGGEPGFDVNALKRSAVYEGRMTATHPVAQRFWRVMLTLTREQQTKFLLFTRGSPRWLNQADVLHLSLFERDEPDKTLPQAQTCFFQLKLPQYTSDNTLRVKLLQALEECTTMELE